MLQYFSVPDEWLVSFSALTLLVGQQEGYPIQPVKNRVVGC